MAEQATTSEASGATITQPGPSREPGPSCSYGTSVGCRMNDHAINIIIYNGVYAMSELRKNMGGPSNFSWLMVNEIAGMGWPRTAENIEFLMQEGINHLVTLSPEMLPPVKNYPIRWTLIPVEEFEPPTLENIIEFIRICNEARRNNEAVGVHCRQGLGRTGVMLACYLVYFCDLIPAKAITNVRLQRPYSIETSSQERAVFEFHDYIRSNPEKL